MKHSHSRQYISGVANPQLENSHTLSSSVNENSLQGCILPGGLVAIWLFPSLGLLGTQTDD